MWTVRILKAAESGRGHTVLRTEEYASRAAAARTLGRHRSRNIVRHQDMLTYDVYV